MRNLFSARYSASAVTGATLVLRLVFGLLIVKHGWDKLQHFDATAAQMVGFFGLSGKVATGLVVFAEFFCGILVVIGLLTRFATIPLIIVMAVALIKVHDMDVTGMGQAATLFLGAFLALLIVGPGKASVDGMIGK